MSTTKHSGRGARRNGRRATAPRSAEAQRGTAGLRPGRASRRPRTALKTLDKLEHMFYNMYSVRLVRVDSSSSEALPLPPFLGGRFVQPEPPFLHQIEIGCNFFMVLSVCQRRNSPHISLKSSAKCRILIAGVCQLTPSPAPCISPLSGADQEGQGRRQSAQALCV